MFDDVAERYDRTNDVLSLGQDRRWRQAVVTALDLRPGERLLDLAAGTGTSQRAVRRGRRADVVPCDFSLGMLRVGKRAPSGPAVRRRRRDPAAVRRRRRSTRSRSRSGCATSSTPTRRCARCCAVTRHGGRLVVCEFSHPAWGPLRTVYTEYLMRALPTVARRVSLQPGRVRLPRRVDPGVARPAGPRPRGSGPPAGTRSRYRNLSGGIVALHRATPPLTAHSSCGVQGLPGAAEPDHPATNGSAQRRRARGSPPAVHSRETREEFHKRT